MISVRNRLGRAMRDPAELLSIGERSKYLVALRVALGIGVVGLALSDPRVHAGRVVFATVLYLAITAAASSIERRSEALVLPVLRGTLLLDGVLLASAMAATGAATSPIRFLAFGHVVVVTLLFSYRSGLKLAMWHTLLYLLVSFSEPAGLIAGGRSYATIETTTIATIAGLWLATLVTATFAALSERELRRQKIDLERLSEMLRRVQAAAGADEIAEILVAELTDTFAFRSGAVLGSPEGELSVIATVGDEIPPGTFLRPDPAVERAVSERSVVALHSFDPETDPGLAATFPGSRNVLVVPLLADRGRALGVVVLERGGHQRGIRRWVVAMVEQFVSHGALALNAAWLVEERQARIREIQELQRQLEAHNADLETTVAERTGELRTAISHLEEVDAQRRRLLDHVVRVGEEERQRIAGDIHDDPVQKLVALKMRLELLGKAHPELEGIPEARDSVLVAIRSLRHLLFDLRPPVLDEQGLGPALRSFLENAETTFRWVVQDDLVEQPSAQTRLILYRIAQEALTNARKHASAEHVRVRVSESEGGVALEIVDDGVGFQPHVGVVAAPGHMGLAAMRERAEMAGGRCELHSLPGQGTTLDVWMPASLDRTEPTGVDERDLASFASLDPEIDGEAAEWVVPLTVVEGSGNGSKARSVI